MNSDFPQTPREELEARVTALLLGELSAEDAAAVRQAITQDAALTRLHDQLRNTINLVHEAASASVQPTAAQPAPLKFAAERREKLLTQFKTVAVPQLAPVRRRDLAWLMPMSAAALFIVLIGSIALLPSLAKSKAKAQRITVAFNPVAREEEIAQRPATEFAESLQRNGRADFGTVNQRLAETRSKDGSAPMAKPDANQPMSSRLSFLADEADHDVAAITTPDSRNAGVSHYGIALPSQPQEPSLAQNLERSKTILQSDFTSGGFGGGGLGGGDLAGKGVDAQSVPAVTTVSGRSSGGVTVEGIGKSATEPGFVGVLEQREPAPEASVNHRFFLPASESNSDGLDRSLARTDSYSNYRFALGAERNSTESAPTQPASGPVAAGSVEAKGGDMPIGGPGQNRSLAIQPQLGASARAADDFAGTTQLSHQSRDVADDSRNAWFGSARQLVQPGALAPGSRVTNGNVVREFLGYDDPGPFVAQSQAVAGNTVGTPLVSALPVPKFRVIEQGQGNVELSDGGVQQASTSRLRESLRNGSDAFSTAGVGGGLGLAGDAVKKAETIQGASSPAAADSGVIRNSPALALPAQQAGESARGEGQTAERNVALAFSNGTIQRGGAEDSLASVAGNKMDSFLVDPDKPRLGQLQGQTGIARGFQGPSHSGAYPAGIDPIPAIPGFPILNGSGSASSGGNQLAGRSGRGEHALDFFGNDTQDKSKSRGNVVLPGLSQAGGGGGQTAQATQLGRQGQGRGQGQSQQLVQSNQQVGQRLLWDEIALAKKPVFDVQDADQKSAQSAVADLSDGTALRGTRTDDLKEDLAGLPVAAIPSPVTQLGTVVTGSSSDTKRSGALMDAEAAQQVIAGFEVKPATPPVAKESKVPVLGDIPLLGRFFRSKANAGAEGAIVGDEVVDAGQTSVPKLKQDARILLEMGRPNEAEAKLKQAASRDPANATTRYYSEAINETRFGDEAKKRELNEPSDALVPKSSRVVIVDEAEALPKSEATLWGVIRDTLAGGTKRTVRLEVGKDTPDIAPLLMEAQGPNGFDPYFIQTEFEKIKSTAVLYKVIEKLKLDEAWAKEGTAKKLSLNETYQRLIRKMDVRQFRNSQLVEINVWNNDPEEAARIANTVAEVYRDTRQEQRNRVALAQAQVLKGQLAVQAEGITSAKDSGAQKSDEDRPAPRQPAPNAPVPQPEAQTRENAFSTFSLNVSDVSFKLAAASLEKGQMPDAATVRSEEFINAFDYRDPEPAPGVPVAFAWERARYPFAHNRDLVRFSVKTAAAGRQAGRPLNLVLLLDNSGSMERADRVRIVQEALRVLASQLKPQDKVSVISFARTPRLWVDGAAGNQAGEAFEQVSGITPQGGTNLEEAMNLAYATARRHYVATGVNRVVLLTDGAANLGNVEPESLKQKVEAQRKQGIALDAFGIGWEGLNDDLLETLSRNGDGRYGFINSPAEAVYGFADQLAGALKVAASDVKVQVEFNPKRVTAYRQIGYAKHQLTKEQFRDNTVDAAEIGAAEAGNALYTLEVNPAGSGPLATVRVRFKIPGTNDYREHEWTVPFNGNAAALEQSSPAMRLAASASAFSEWLVASPFAAEVTPDRLLSLVNGVPETFGADERPRKLEWMIRQAKSLAGK